MSLFNNYTTDVSTFAAIPGELKSYAHWVGYRLEERDGKDTKVPYDTTTGGYASVTDSRTWASFDDAIAGCRRNGFDGLGFVFSSGDPFTGVDLDDAIDHGGDAKPWALAIVERLKSYTEYSRSGTGLHVIIKGSLPGPGGKRKVENGDTAGAVEVYDQKRFFVVTGQPFGGEG